MEHYKDNYSEKTKILFILGSGIYPHIVGGMEIFNFYFIANLKKYFNIFHTSTKPLKTNDIKWIKTYLIKPIKLFSPLQVLITLLFKPSIKKVVISYSAAHWLVWYLYTLINTLLRRDYYVIIHYGDATPKGTYKVYKKFFNKAKRVIAVSGDIKNNYDKEYGIDCKVLYPLVPFEICNKTKKDIREEFGIPEDAFLTCMVGSIKDMKHPETILDAVAKFDDKEMEQYNPHIVYAGSGQMLQDLKDKAKDGGIENRVHFLGFVPKEEVNKVFKMSDAYVIASDFEGTSVSLLEAMYNRLPILASNAPGIKDMVSHNHSALMFETKKAEDLKERILSLLKDKTLSNALCDNAYKDYNAKYNYDDMLNDYITIFNE
ncbi:MAG: glycosyltransferase family 4 protein [Bacteroidaceae bacterium]|nr:glycosyltransferase family 4 protein [Bacteroidaceae bacterium]